MPTHWVKTKSNAEGMGAAEHQSTETEAVCLTLGFQQHSESTVLELYQATSVHHSYT